MFCLGSGQIEVLETVSVLSGQCSGGERAVSDSCEIRPLPLGRTREARASCCDETSSSVSGNQPTGTNVSTDPHHWPAHTAYTHLHTDIQTYARLLSDSLWQKYPSVATQYPCHGIGHYFPVLVRRHDVV